MGLLKGIVLFVGDTHTDVSLNLYLGLFIYLFIFVPVTNQLLFPVNFHSIEKYYGSQWGK